MWAAVAWVSSFIVAYIFLSWIRRWIRVDNISSRFILITGCDSGYGNLLAQRLDMLGCRVFAACVSETSKHRLQQMTSSRLRAFTMDTTNGDSVRQGLEYISLYVTENEGLWALVNCEDILGDVMGPIEWHSVDDVVSVFSTNTLGVVRMTQTFLPLLKKTRGRVINLCPIEGRVVNPFSIPYSMSKAAIETFSDGIRCHLSQYGVTVHVIEPGVFQYDISLRQRTRKAIQQGWKSAPSYVKEEFGESYMEKLTSHMINNIENATPKVNKVIEAFVHTLTARCPRTRYTVGWDAYFYWIPLCYTPSSVTDFFLCKWTNDIVPASLQKETTKPVVTATETEPTTTT